jgi:hypothetical protein
MKGVAEPQTPNSHMGLWLPQILTSPATATYIHTYICMYVSVPMAFWTATTAPTHPPRRHVAALPPARAPQRLYTYARIIHTLQLL